MNTKTTEMMVEYLISGILGLFALLFLFCCIFDGIKEKLLDPDTWKYFEDNIFFTIPLFIALAYSFGIVFESISLISLEWIHKRIKKT